MGVLGWVVFFEVFVEEFEEGVGYPVGAGG